MNGRGSGGKAERGAGKEECRKGKMVFRRTRLERKIRNGGMEIRESRWKEECSREDRREKKYREKDGKQSWKRNGGITRNGESESKEWKVGRSRDGGTEDR